VASRRIGKVLAAVVAVAAIATVPACNREEDDKPKIGFAMTLDHPYWNNFHSGAIDEGKKLGVEVIITDAKEDAGTQIRQIKSLIAAGVDALCVVPMKPDELVPGIKEANDRNIPVIIVNRTIGKGCDYVCYIGTNTYEGAVTSAKILMEAIGGAGGIIEFRQHLGSGPQLLRTKALQDVLTDYPNVHILREIVHKGDRKLTTMEMKALLADAELAPQIKGVYAHGDNYAIAVGEVCRDRGRSDIAIVGMGGSQEAIEAIKDDLITGTSFQQPEEEGRRAVRKAVEYLKNKKLDKKEYLIPCPAITKENAHKFKGQF